MTTEELMQQVAAQRTVIEAYVAQFAASPDGKQIAMTHDALILQAHACEAMIGRMTRRMTDTAALLDVAARALRREPQVGRVAVALERVELAASTLRHEINVLADDLDAVRAAI